MYSIFLDYCFSITCLLSQGTYRPRCCPVSRFVHSPLRPVSLQKVDDRSVDRAVFLLDRDSLIYCAYAAAAPNTLASAFDLRSSRLTSGLSVSSVDLNQPIAHLAIAFRFVVFYFISFLFELFIIIVLVLFLSMTIVLWVLALATSQPPRQASLIVSAMHSEEIPVVPRDSPCYGRLEYSIYIMLNITSLCLARDMTVFFF